MWYKNHNNLTKLNTCWILISKCDRVYTKHLETKLEAHKPVLVLLKMYSYINLTVTKVEGLIKVYMYMYVMIPYRVI